MISTTPVKQRRRRKSLNESTKPDRGTVYVYEISTASGKYQVCKKAFVSIHGVTNERVRRLTTLLSQGKAPIDKRGLNTSGNAIPGLVIDTIKEHINSFPTKLSHYSNNEYYYLSEKLNLIIMHNLFKEKHPNLNVKYNFYRKIFLESFSLKFGHPQVDTCGTCEELEVKIKNRFLSDAAKRVYIAEKLVHIRKSKKFFKKIKEISDLAKTSDSVGAICIDYMQNLQLPCIPVQETFYLRQLTVSVFCIHNLKDDNVAFFVYHEGMGTKGPNEVSSFLVNYFATSMTGVENLHIFSDGCGSQNKNHTILRVFSALVTLGKYKTINQYFPIRGHSFLPCDRDFSILKRKIKKCDRIYTLKQCIELIVTSSHKKSFLVTVPDCGEIIDYKNWWPYFYKKNMLSVESVGKRIPRDEKVNLKISQFMQFTHSSDNEGVVVARNYIDGIQRHTFRLRNTKPGLTLPSAKAYAEGKIPINKKKMEDILKLKQYLPDDEEVNEFYDDIFAWPTCDKENNDTEIIQD